ncbi:hypothetical protein MRX96_008878 [Rhipicephalus microplus]
MRPKQRGKRRHAYSLLGPRKKAHQGKEGLEQRIINEDERRKRIGKTPKSLNGTEQANHRSFSSLPLTSRLKQQIVNLDGIVFSVKCRGSVPKEGTPCISCKYLRKALLTRRSELKQQLQVTPAKKLRLLSQKNRRARARLISLTASLNDMRAQCASVRKNSSDANARRSAQVKGAVAPPVYVWEKRFTAGPLLGPLPLI